MCAESRRGRAPRRAFGAPGRSGFRSLLLVFFVLSYAGGAFAAAPEVEAHAAGERLSASENTAEPVGSTLPSGSWAVQLALGKSFGEPLHEVGPFEWIGNLRVGLSDRVQLSVLSPGIAWRLGDPGTVELILDARIRFGARGYGVEAIPWPGASVRLYAGSSSSLLLGAQAGIVLTHDDRLRVWMWSSQAGWIQRLGSRLTLSAGVAANVEREVTLFAAGGGPRSTTAGVGTAFGSVLFLASTPVPLISFSVSDAFSLDGYGSVLLHPDDKVEAISQVGFTARF